MTATFHIYALPERDLLSATLKGFFSPEDVERFALAQMRAHRQLRCPLNQHVTVVDIRDMQIQSQDTVVAFQKLLAQPNRKGRAIAFVVSQSLARMQAQRVATGREANFFSTADAATDWLFRERTPAV